MAKYRKKPVVIDAIQLGDTSNLDQVRDFLGGEEKRNIEFTIHYGTGVVHIVTPEGTMRADIGDWIIRGVKGEFYPCKPDIFAMTYDAEEGI